MRNITLTACLQITGLILCVSNLSLSDQAIKIRPGDKFIEAVREIVGRVGLGTCQPIKEPELMVGGAGETFVSFRCSDSILLRGIYSKRQDQTEIFSRVTIASFPIEARVITQLVANRLVPDVLGAIRTSLGLKCVSDRDLSQENHIMSLCKPDHVEGTIHGWTVFYTSPDTLPLKRGQQTRNTDLSFHFQPLSKLEFEAMSTRLNATF